MNATPVLHVVTKALEQAQIPYMITGSFASNYYGTPRTTGDIDFVIAADPSQLKILTQQLQQKGYYAQVEDALDAWRNNSMFNAIDDSMAWKIDFIMRKPGIFSQEAFQRRVPGEIQGAAITISTVEDLIIAKLDWAKQGESPRQVEDVVNVLKVSTELIDRNYVEKWVTDLGLTAQWQSAKQAAGIE